ncbi:MAG TPA: mandelate racemase/muconate lactonizing enzyme family protein [Thermodesulfobacteriota bacterium]|nr:mandelate racemase/muconate lactonizing enzyme family protein [Thermodesulfobacteriota bacterium]
MKITKVEAIPFHIPFDPDFHLKFAYRTSGSADHVLIRIYTDDGIVGISEAPSRQEIYGETQKSIVGIIDECLGPSLLGRDPFLLEEIHTLLDRIPHNYCAKGGVDIALHDIIGKALNVPLYRFLGGKSRDRVPVSWMVGINPPEKMAEECGKFMARGIQAFKVKAGVDYDLDRERFLTIRKAVGEKALLYIDANQGFKSLKKTIALLAELEKHGLAFVEEPFPVRNRKDRVEAARSISIPIMGDESCFTPADVADELQLGALGIVLVKVARTGFYRTRKIAHMCREAGIPCMIGSQGDSSIGAAASLHAAVAFANILFPAEVSYHLRMRGELLRNPPEFRNGELTVPEGPGLGVEIDEAALRKFQA